MVFRVTPVPRNGTSLAAGLRDALQSTPGLSSTTLISFENGVGILRCPHRRQQEVIRSLRALQHLESTRVTVTTLGVSGTIKKARVKYLADGS